MNIDAWMQSNSDVVGRLEDIKLSNESVGFIYCSHALEHVSHQDCAGVLAEWFRILKPGGRLYVCVPDVEVLFTLYLQNLPSYSEKVHQDLVDDTISVVYGQQTYKNNFHKNGFSFATLSHALTSAGFVDIDRFDPDENDHPFILPLDLSRAQRAGRLVSPNLTALKPSVQSAAISAAEVRSER